MFPFAPVLEGVACMTGAWIALLGLGGHFPKALRGTFCLYAAEPGIPAGANFHRSRLYFSEDEVKAGLHQAACAWRRETTNADELSQATLTSLSHCCPKSIPFSGVKMDSVEPRPCPQPRAGEGMCLKPRAYFSTLYRPCPCIRCRGGS